MKTTKNLPTEKEIKFVKEVALDYGHSITNEEATKCIQVCGDDYYEMKEYFLN